MGWWGYNVMEGDKPLDAQCYIEQSLGGEVAIDDDDMMTDDKIVAAEDQHNENITKALKGAHYHELIEEINSGEHEWPGRDITLQVLGEMIMCFGGKMSDRTKGTFRQAARNDAWAKEPCAMERRRAMLEYIKRIDAYDGTAIQPTSTGLMDVIFQKIESGEAGLVNVQ